MSDPVPLYTLFLASMFGLAMPEGGLMATETEGPLVDVELTDQQRTELLEAPRTYLNAEPSEALAEAMASGRIENVRADRAANSPAGHLQGWIYFAEVNGVRPIVLCVSDGPQVIWVHCQEEPYGGPGPSSTLNGQLQPTS